VAHSQEGGGATRAGQARDADRVAAVVLHVLAGAPRVLTVAQIAVACERDPRRSADRETIERALSGLVEDGLAYRRGACFGATRAALRALELSF
jgi:hypothetical protein